MMCYDNNGGAFDFTKREYELLFNLCDDRNIELEQKFQNEYFYPHLYLENKQLISKLDGILKLIENKK